MARKTTIKYTSYFENGDQTDAVIAAQIRDNILNNDYLVGRFINHEGTLAPIIIRLESNDFTDQNRVQIIENLMNHSEKILGQEGVYYGGIEVSYYFLNKLSRHDFILFMGINFFLAFACMYLFYRNWYYILLVVGSTFTATLLTFSIYGILGFRLNIFTIVIPPLIIILGVAIVMHIINEFHREIEKDEIKDRRQLVIKSLSAIFKPCLFTTITTMVGFLSLLTSGTAVLKEFGFFSALGVLLVFVCSFIYAALLLLLTDAPRSKTSERIGDKLYSATEWIFRHEKKLWFAIFAVFLIIGFSIASIKVDMYPFAYFPKEHKVVQDHNKIQELWGDYLPLSLLITTKDGYDLRNPTVVNKLIAFEKDVTGIYSQRSPFSYMDILNRFSLVLYKRPFSEIMNRPFILPVFISSFRKMVENEENQDLIASEFAQTMLTLYGPQMSIGELESGVEKIESIAVHHLSDVAEVEVAGYSDLIIRMMNYAVSSMEKSLLLAYLLIFLTMIILWRNIRLAIIALIPNIFPILVYLALLGILGINLDLATSTIAAIVLGIAVDDTIHFVNRYHQEKKANAVREAIKITQLHVGRILVLTSIVLMLGLLALLFADVRTVVNFGLLAGLSIVAALLADVVLLPMLLKKFDRSTSLDKVGFSD